MQFCFSARVFLFALLAFLAFCPTAQAQLTLAGSVTDERAEGIPFAAIFLQKQLDSNLIQTALCDSLGNFRMVAATNGGAFLKIAAAGYQDQYFPIKDSGTSLSSLRFVLLPLQTGKLSGVTVTATKPLIERKVDRTVFNVASSASAIGGDALEALKRAPGVRVNDHSVSIVGKSTVNVLINDKLVQVSGDELVNLLKSIPSDNLERIEVITTPPARYDAAGNAGMLNIVTKKMLKNGLNGTASLRYMQRISRAGGFNGNFNYRHNDLNVFGFLNMYRANAMPHMGITTQYSDQRWEQVSNVTNRNVFNRGQIGADYNLTPNMVLGLLYTRGNGGDQFNGDATITARGYNRLSGSLDSMMTTRALTEDRGWRNVGNLNFQWKIDSTGKKLNADLDYFSRIGRANRNLTTNNQLADGAPTGFQETSRTSGIQEIDIRTAKLDVEWPTPVVQLTFGGKASFIHNTSNNLFEYQHGAVFVVDTGKTNEFDYRENTQALYVSAQKTMGRWEAQLGLRGEYTQTKSYAATVQQTVHNDYFRLFPTAYIQYKPNDEQAINLNYSKRIERPDFWSMNPFRSYLNATSYSQGNPFLQPSFSNNLELGYTLNGQYSFTLYGQWVDHLQTRISLIDSASKSYSFNYANVGRSQAFGATANATFHPAKWWECTVTGNAWYGRFSSDYYGGGGVGYSRPGFALETEQTFLLNKAKTLIAELSYSYNSRTLNDFDVVSAYQNAGFGIKALLLRQRLILALNGYDVFRTEINHVENQYNGTIQDNYWDERTVRFSVTWKLGSDAIKAQRSRKTGSDDESRVR